MRNGLRVLTIAVLIVGASLTTLAQQKVHPDNSPTRTPRTR